MRIFNFRTKIALFGYFSAGISKKLLPHLKQPQIFQNAMFRAKLKIFKSGTETVREEILKNCCHIQNQFSHICQNTKFHAKAKKLKTWDQKYLLWTFLGRILQKTVVIFEISTLAFVKVKEIHVKPKRN